MLVKIPAWHLRHALRRHPFVIGVGVFALDPHFIGHREINTKIRLAKGLDISRLARFLTAKIIAWGRQAQLDHDPDIPAINPATPHIGV